MPIKRWRALKGLVYVVIMAVVALAGIVEQGPIIAVAFMVGAVLIFGIEISEIQIADWVSIQFEGEVEGRGIGRGENKTIDDAEWEE